MPVVWTVQVHPAWAHPLGRASLFRRSSYVVALRLLDRVTTETVFVSEGLAEQVTEFIGRTPCRWSVVRNAIDVKRYRPSISSRQLFRAKLGISEDIRVVGVLARLIPRKGIDTFIRAMSLLTDRHVMGLIAGEGPLKDELESLTRAHGLGKRIRFLGHLESAEKFVAAIDVGVLVSRGEGFPLAVMEMMSAGVPVIVSDIPMHRGFREAVGAVAFVPPDDPKALALAMDNVLERSRSAEMGERARQFAENSFSTDRMVAGYCEVYRRVTMTSGGSGVAQVVESSQKERGAFESESR